MPLKTSIYIHITIIMNKNILRTLPVQFFKTETAIVLLLNLTYSVPEQLQNIVNIVGIHLDLKEKKDKKKVEKEKEEAEEEGEGSIIRNMEGYPDVHEVIQVYS